MTRGAVATPHPVATRTAVRTLERGGSAVDAAIAASSVLCVVAPHMVTLGGDAWAVISRPGSAPVAVDGSGRAPRALPDRVADSGAATMPSRGVLSMTVPGGVAAWGEMHRRFGRLPFGELLADAGNAARDGVPVSAGLARDAAEHVDVLARDPGAAARFLPGGVPLAEGDELRQPELAATLAALAEHGPDALYRGLLAERLVAGLAAVGAPLTLADLAAHETDVVEPLRARVGDRELVVAPPASQAWMIVPLARALLAGTGPADVARLARDLSRVRRAESADRDHLRLDPEALLDAVPGRVPHDPEPGLHGGDTVAISVVDDDDLGVSLIQSVSGTFGSGVLEPGTGILLHNRAAGFSLDARDAGVLAPGRRPPHTLSPALVLSGDPGSRLEAVIGTMGGPQQPLILAHVFAALASGADPRSSVDAPRWVVTDPTVDDPATILVEEGVAPGIAADLARAGLPLAQVPSTDNRLGHAQVVVREGSGWRAASDRRAG